MLPACPGEGLVSSLFFLPPVRRQGCEPSVLDWAAYREVVETLPITRSNAERLGDGIVEVAAHASRTNARLFGLKVQHLAEETGLPEQIPVESGTERNQAVRVVGDHPQAEGTIPSDVL